MLPGHRDEALDDRDKAILKAIPKHGKISVSDIQSETNIPMNKLTKRLQRLEEDILVIREVVPDRPPSTYYRFPIRIPLKITSDFLNPHIAWLEKIQNADGSWCELETNSTSNELGLLKQKIVYTNQVMRLLKIAATNDTIAARGFDFMANVKTIGNPEYDHLLRFYSLYYFGQIDLAEKAAYDIATSQRKSGIFESKRYLGFWFGLLYLIEVLNTYDRNIFNAEIKRATQLLRRNFGETNCDDSPSITSWALRLMKETGNLRALPHEGRRSLSWLQDKLNGQKWNQDFEPTRDSVTPETACDLTTTSHVLINLLALADIMTEDQRKDCLVKPFKWIKAQSKGVYFKGKSKKDPFVTALSLRAIIEATKIPP